MSELQYKLQYHPGKLKGIISIDGSKSISNRLLILRSLAESQVVFKNLSKCDDTQRLKKALKMISVCASSRIPMVVDAGNAGTVMRFLTAFLAIKEGKWLLTGIDRMQKRPIKGLVGALEGMGGDIRYTGKNGFPPLFIEGSNLQGRSVAMDASVSSQFVSALMMISPLISNGLTILFKRKPVSFSYIRMTAGLMEEFGILCELSEDKVIIPEGEYKPKNMMVEPDWSSASYWYQMTAIHGDAELFLAGFQKNSIQGDRVVADIFKSFGVETKFEPDGIRISTTGKVSDNIEYNFENCPDLVPAVLASCAALNVKASVSGVDHLQFKESDRIQVLKKELEKVGATFDLAPSQIKMLPDTGKIKSELVFDTHNDHRIAMCLAPLVLKYKEVIINDPKVVEKSYLDFWKDIRRTGIVTVDKI